jgi:hypothetical protein
MEKLRLVAPSHAIILWVSFIINHHHEPTDTEIAKTGYDWFQSSTAMTTTTPTPTTSNWLGRRVALSRTRISQTKKTSLLRLILRVGQVHVRISTLALRRDHTANVLLTQLLAINNLFLVVEPCNSLSRISYDSSRLNESTYCRQRRRSC